MFGFFAKTRKERFRRQLAARWEAISEFADGLECTRLLRSADEILTTYATIKEWPEFQAVDWNDGIKLSRLAFRTADERRIEDYSTVLLPVLEHHAQRDNRECCPSLSFLAYEAEQTLGRPKASPHYPVLPFADVVAAYLVLEWLQEQQPVLADNLETSKRLLRASLHAMAMIQVARHATRLAEKSMEAGRAVSGGLSDLIPRSAQEAVQAIGAPALHNIILEFSGRANEDTPTLLLAAAFQHSSYEEIVGNCSYCLFFDGLADAWRALDELTVDGLLSDGLVTGSSVERALHHALYVADQELYDNHRPPSG